MGNNVTTYATTVGQMGGDGRTREAYKSSTQNETQRRSTGGKGARFCWLPKARKK